MRLPLPPRHRQTAEPESAGGGAVVDPTLDSEIHCGLSRGSGFFGFAADEFLGMSWFCSVRLGLKDYFLPPAALQGGAHRIAGATLQSRDRSKARKLLAHDGHCFRIAEKAFQTLAQLRQRTRVERD